MVMILFLGFQHVCVFVMWVNCAWIFCGFLILHNRGRKCAQLRLSASWIQLDLWIASLKLYFIQSSHAYAIHPINTLQTYTDLRRLIRSCNYTLHHLDSVVCVWLCLCVCILLCNHSTFRTLISTSCSLVQEAASFSDSWIVSIFLVLLAGSLHAALCGAGELWGSVWRVNLSEDVEWDCCDGDRAGLSIFSLSLCLSVPPKPVHLLPRGPVPPAPRRPLPSPPPRARVPSAGAGVGRLIEGFHSSR